MTNILCVISFIPKLNINVESLFRNLNFFSDECSCLSFSKFEACVSGVLDLRLYFIFKEDNEPYMQIIPFF